MSPAPANIRPSANTPTRSLPPVPSPTSTANTPPQSVTPATPRVSQLVTPTAIPRRSYADAVLVEDVDELEEASEEGIAPPAVLPPPPVPLFEEPLVRTGKRTRTKPKSYNVGHKNVPKYEYGHNHLQTDPKMRPMPKKFEYGSIHLQTAGIVSDMYAIAAANSDTGELLPMTEQDRDDYIMGIIMTQYSLNKGLKEFGDRGEEAVVKELSSLKDMDTFFPMDAETLTKEQRAKAISSLMFLKEKRDGTIKGRACAIGTPQRAYIKKEDAASPTCATESVFITSVVDAHERRHVASFDVPTAFLHALTEEDVVMRLEGRLAK